MMWRKFLVATLIAIVGGVTVARADEACEMCPYEATSSCHADLTGDGVVDVEDLTLVLSGFGGAYNCWDLYKVEGNWGPCPEGMLDPNDDDEFNYRDVRFILDACEADCRVDVDRNRVVDGRDLEAWTCLVELNDLVNGDMDRDGAFTMADELLILEATMVERQPCVLDYDGDGKVGWSDVVIVVEDDKKID